MISESRFLYKPVIFFTVPIIGFSQISGEVEESHAYARLSFSILNGVSLLTDVSVEVLLFEESALGKLVAKFWINVAAPGFQD